MVNEDIQLCYIGLETLIKDYNFPFQFNFQHQQISRDTFSDKMHHKLEFMLKNSTDRALLAKKQPILLEIYLQHAAKENWYGLLLPKMNFGCQNTATCLIMHKVN